MDLLTVTHARIRAAQGDLSGARRILHQILDRSPDHREARALLEGLAGRTDLPHRDDSETRLEDRRPATGSELAGEFRSALGRLPRNRRLAQRLETWLRRISRSHQRDP